MISRRDLLRGAGTVGLLGWPPRHAAAEPPPETTRLRIGQQPSLCVAPQYVVGELLKAEGFTDIKYVKTTIAGVLKALASGEIDVSMGFVGPLLIQLDAGAPLTALGGVHPGFRGARPGYVCCFRASSAPAISIVVDPQTCPRP